MKKDVIQTAFANHQKAAQANFAIKKEANKKIDERQLNFKDSIIDKISKHKIKIKQNDLVRNFRDEILTHEEIVKYWE